MRTDYGYAEEETVGKPYDVHLLKRLYPFAGPYRTWILVSVFIVVLITLLELALPYITKVAIDRYIVPPGGSASALQDDAAGSGEHRLTVDMTDPQVRDVVMRYPTLFTVSGARATVSYMDLATVDRADVYRLKHQDLSGLTWAAVAFLVVVILNFCLTFTQVILMERAGQNMLHDLRIRLYSHIQNQSLDFFSRNPVGRLVTRVTNDVQNMHELFTSVIVFIFKDLFLLLGIAGVLLAIDLKLAAASFMVLPLVAWASVFFARRAREAFRMMRVKIAEINTRFAEGIEGLKVIQLFLQERHVSRRFNRVNHDYYEAGMNQVRVFAVFMPVIEVLGAAALATIIYYGGRSVIAQRLSLGELVAFISYMKMFFRPIRDVAEKYNIMQNAMASAERIFLMFDARDVLTAETGDGVYAAKPPAVTDIRFEAVSFGYTPDEPVLRSVTFAVEKNETVAVVGPTGSGKTTVINLAARFYDPDDGRIFINGRDTRKMHPAEVRSMMALVTQEPVLFSGTIRDNILKGNCRLSDVKMDRILRASRCDALVNRLPDGLDTRLSESGASLSSGERQLISIARAFACDPPLIILDEATSYIDSETEQMIQEAMDNLMKHRTAIVVAHRLSTVRHADRILVMNRGKIVESGSHDDLMHRRGFYYELNRMWMNNGPASGPR